MEKDKIDYQAIAHDLAKQCEQLKAALAQERARNQPRKRWWQRLFGKPQPMVSVADAEEMLEELRLRMKVTRLLSADKEPQS